MTDLASRFMEHLADDARRRAIDQRRENLMHAGMLGGGEIHILGRRVRLHIEWLDEQPPAEFLQEMAATLRRGSHREIIDGAGAFCADCGTELTDNDGRRLDPVPECKAST